MKQLFRDPYYALGVTLTAAGLGLVFAALVAWTLR